MKKTKNIIFITGIFITAALGLQSCKTETKPEETARESFVLTDTMMTKLGFDEVTSKVLLSEVKLSGKITANEDKVAKVFPRVDGNIEKLNVQLGDYVQKGQILAIIRSRQVAEMDNQLSMAMSNLQIARKNLGVEEELFKAGLEPERNLVNARQEVQKAEAELKRVHETMKIYDLGKEATYQIKSPISGFLIEKNAVEGMDFNIENIDNFFTISDLSDVWVLADVYETDINKVKIGYTCDITTLADPDRKIKGKIDKIFNVLDPESRVLKVRIRLPNPGYTLKPQMFAIVRVYHEEAQTMPAIPAKAIIFDKSRQWVMVFKDRRHIETRQVKVFKTVGDYAYIESGLALGEKIISNQQLLVYDALNN
ncbi:efflux RND transporter periplasmic adaptor subunit [Emticicia fluvialis]|uniref:efflux RND transporter periplasmic adaptor subunit n=1 Tax=Emticicia fluvialis TaxID=2974474 RepID=UPI002164FCBB|nr:efflux RND transporter periplasmic adaptor subunit [Emticicia fluvialis]